MSRLVTIALPALDEESAIGECLERIRRQSHTELQVLVADGGSTDATRTIVEEASASDPRIEMIDNPGRLQSAGLNRALAAARGDVIVRLDARSFVAPDYVARCLHLLESTGAAVVGGRMVARPASSAIARGIAIANGAWWAAGPAGFHSAGAPGPAETVYLGTFRREWLEKLGGWAEDVGVNEDYELNHRIRRAGGVVWLDPTLEVGYEPRSTLTALAKQYFRYGRSKAATVRRHPSSVRPRQVAPAGLAVAAGMAVLAGPIGRVARQALLAHAVGMAALGATARGTPAERAAGFVAGWLMHWCWSGGFWFGTIRPMPPAGTR